MSNEYDPAGERPGRRLNLDEPLIAPRPRLATAGSHALDQSITAVYAAMTLAETHSQAIGCWHALRPLLEAKFGREEGR